MGKVILTAGYVAAGKTTFSEELARRLRIPAFHKDHIKAALAEHVNVDSREVSKRLSGAAFSIMVQVAEKLMGTEVPFLLESNFTPPEEEILGGLLRRYHCQCLSYVFQGDLHVLHRRFLERDKSAEREPANRVHGLFDDYALFEECIRPLGGFSLGDRVVAVDATRFDRVDYEGLYQVGRDFLAV